LVIFFWGGGCGNFFYLEQKEDNLVKDFTQTS
jgi:hypothetical protein